MWARCFHEKRGGTVDKPRSRRETSPPGSFCRMISFWSPAIPPLFTNNETRTTLRDKHLFLLYQSFVPINWPAFHSKSALHRQRPKNQSNRSKDVGVEEARLLAIMISDYCKCSKYITGTTHASTIGEFVSIFRTFFFGFKRRFRAVG